MPVKAEDLVPHACKEQFGGLDYCITSPPPWSAHHTKPY
jgi:nucleobase transporter 1/2